MDTNTPASSFATLARQEIKTTPIPRISVCGIPVTIMRVCPVCRLPLRPNQIHIVDGFECQERQQSIDLSV